MSGVERPESIPPLEPLGAPDDDSSQDQTTAPSHRPLSIIDGKTNQKLDRKFSQVFREAIAPPNLRLVLENKGNVARDHLASERTYLAYVRTSLACASASVALVQLFALDRTRSTSSGEEDLTKFAKFLGAAIIIFGLIILVFGVVRYFNTQSSLVRGHFPVARNTIMIIAVILGLLVVIVFSILLAGK